MKRTNELLVGGSVMGAFALVIGGAIWLSQTHIGERVALRVGRFRTVGGLAVGAPVTLRGVKVGRVQTIRLADDNWVEADLRIQSDVVLPQRPAVIAASASLFGEWQAAIIPQDPPSENPELRAMLAEAAKAGADRWPGATLPDIGQLTAQASRIAGDVGLITNRIQGAFDSNAVADLRKSIGNLRAIADRLVQLTNSESSSLTHLTNNMASTSDVVSDASKSLQTTLRRVDSATSRGQLTEILNNAQTSSRDIQSASADLRELLAVTRKHRESLVRVLEATDSVMTRIQSGKGTLSLLAQDSTLYHEATQTVVELRSLIADIKANPRRYFRFSVF